MGTLIDRKTRNQSTVLRNGALGMILFVATEIMFFSGLISSFIVNAADNIGEWPPKWQPRLPVLTTGFNTLLLIASAVTLFLAIRGIRNQPTETSKSVNRLMITTVALGAGFVTFQGIEWVNLIHAGMTTSSSLFGAFFYMIIGFHGVHALGGIIYLFFVSRKIIREQDIERKKSMMSTLSIYWYFVVLLWPVLYYLVYVIPSRS